MYLTRLASLHRMAEDNNLFINALSGAVDLVSDELRANLLQLAMGQPVDLHPHHRKALIERKYLFSNEVEEQAAVTQIWEAYQLVSRKRPLQFVVCPTYSCNLACSYCFESGQIRKTPRVLSSEQIEHLFTALRELAGLRENESCQMVLFGGEPLLPTTELAIAALLDRAANAGYTVQVVTNGTHLDGFCSLLARYRAILTGAQVTLDGPQAIHDFRRRYADGRGSFAQVVRGIQACLDAGLEVNVRVNLDAHNLRALPELADFFQLRGWAGQKGFRCQLAPITDHLGTSPYPFRMREDELVEPVLALWQQRPDLKTILDFRLFKVLNHLISVIESGNGTRTLPRFHYCEAARGEIFAFGPDGLIYACPEAVGSSPNAIGRFFPHYTLWPRRLAKWGQRSVLDLPECRNCNIATFCGGGCPYSALHHFGSPAHGVCAEAQDVVKAYIKVLRKRLTNGDSTWMSLASNHPVREQCSVSE